MKLPPIVGLHGLQSDGKGTVTFTFKSADDRTHYVPMRAGVLNALLAPVISVSKEVLDDQGKTLDLQPITLTAARKMVLDDGTPVLEVRLDGIPLRIALPQGAIQGLRSVLTELENVTTKPTTGVRH